MTYIASDACSVGFPLYHSIGKRERVHIECDIMNAKQIGALEPQDDAGSRRSDASVGSISSGHGADEALARCAGHEREAERLQLGKAGHEREVFLCRLLG